MQALTATTRRPRLHLQHQKSHVGHPGNELADGLAKFCNRHILPDLFWPTNPMQPFLREGWLPWLWLYLDSFVQPESWPEQIGASFVDRPGPMPELPTQAECEQMLGLRPQDNIDDGSEQVSLSALFLTVNVQSLHSDRTTPAAEPDARAGLIREQLAQLGVSVAALQETRAHSNELFQSQTHLRFVSSRDDQGSYGTELWFSRSHPFISHPTTPVYFEPADFLAVFWDPRTIAVRFARGAVRILFVSIHAPTSTDPHRERWWTNLCHTVERLRQNAQVVILGDFNVHIDRAYKERTGDLTWPSQSEPPRAFWRFLDIFDLWIPSTHTCCHDGPSATWRSPTGHTSSRIDYVAVPTSWQVPAGGSRVYPELEWGQARVDHYAALVAAQTYIRLGAPRSSKLPRLDTQGMRTAEGAAKIAAICQALPMQPWNLDVHRHAARIESHFKALLPLAFSVTGARQRKPHLLPATWQLRNQRAWLRKRVHSATQFCHSFSVRAFFIAWRTGQPVWTRGHKLWARLLQSLKSLPGHLDDLRRTSPELRARIRDDTRLHLHEIAIRAVTSPTKDTVRRLRDLTGPPRRKQRGATPLPAVEVTPGKLAATHQEAKEKWISHFSAIEDGTVKTAQEIVHSCYLRQHDKDLASYEVTADEAPCLAELETSLRAASVDRAYGFDGVPGEVARYGAPFLAKAIFQLELKSVLRLAEPVQHKGGTLYCVWKRKGPRQDCAAYRGILVSSVLGKSLHKTIRGRCTDSLALCTTPLQVGGLPSFPVSLPAHSARLFQSACRAKKMPHSLLFLDLQEAFYRIIRPLISGESVTTEAAAHICAAAQLPAGTVHELHDFLGQGSLLRQSGTSPWAAQAVEETLCNTWFRFPNECEIVETRSGSRPGDSLSDLVFSFLFSKVLHQVRQALTDAGYLAKVPCHPAMQNAIYPVSEAPTTELGLSDATWMDDLLLFLMAPDAPTLLRALSFGASSLLDACLQRALVPNLAQGKTEALVHLCHRGSRTARRHLYGDLGGELPLDCRLWQGAVLRTVPTYRHLGGYLQHNGGLAQEIRFRSAQAWDAFRRRKKRLFGSPLVPTQDKSLLFDSLVATVLFYGSGTWPAINERHHQTFTSVLRQMACQMLRPRYTCEEAWHLGTSQALALAGIPQATTYFHVFRLRYLLSCIRLDSREIWALAHWEEGWLSLVRDSLTWLVDIERGPATPHDVRRAWQDWSTEACAHPGRWKSRIRRALATALRRERWTALTEWHVGLLARQARHLGATCREPETPPTTGREICALCNVTFRDFRSWAVHAFKRHGRVGEVRRLGTGQQCAHCLRHYATNIRLCRHLQHSTVCRRALLGSKSRSTPAPGVGSRKAPREDLQCTPTLQASGPSLQVPSFEIEAELRRPSAEILHCLEVIDYDHAGDPLPGETLWSRLRTAFSCVCLPACRLHISACAWSGILQQTPIASQTPSHASLVAAAAWLSGTDLVEWLSVSPDVPARVPATLRQGPLVLAGLRTSEVRLPPPSPWTSDHVVVFVGDPARQWAERTQGSSPPVFSHSDTLGRLANGTPVDFLDELDPQCGFCISLIGLPAPFHASCPSPKSFETDFLAAQFACDLTRLVLRLWSRGIRACLIAPNMQREDIAFLASLPGVQREEQQHDGVLWVGSSPNPFSMFHL